LHTIQTGLVMARHICNADTMIQSLVGIAIAHVMLGLVEEMIQQPDAPNLYWALATLPRPFCDIRKPMHYEMATIYRSFPQLREFEKGDLAGEQAQKLLADFAQALCNLTDDDKVGQGIQKLGIAMVVIARLYPDAKKALIAQGRKAEQVEAMPSAQVVG